MGWHNEALLKICSYRLSRLWKDLPVVCSKLKISIILTWNSGCLGWLLVRCRVTKAWAWASLWIQRIQLVFKAVEQKAASLKHNQKKKTLYKRHKQCWMTDEEEIAGALVQLSKLARHTGNTSEWPCGSSCERLTVRRDWQRLCYALSTASYMWNTQVCRGTGVSILGNATPDVTVPGHIFVRNLCYVIALLGNILLFYAYFIQILSAVELIAMVYFVLQIF